MTQSSPKEKDITNFNYNDFFVDLNISASLKNNSDMFTNPNNQLPSPSKINSASLPLLNTSINGDLTNILPPGFFTSSAATVKNDDIESTFGQKNLDFTQNFF